MVTLTHYAEHAPAARLSQKEIMHQVNFLSKAPLLRRLLDFIPHTILIINKQRQIVFANKAALAILKSDQMSDLYGLRHGEALHCIHAKETEGGCGTTKFCHNCGATKSIISGFNAIQTSENYYVTTTMGDKARDFRVTSSPYFFTDEHFVVLVISDISSEHRREILERIFFHDVNNTLSALLASVELMPTHATKQENDIAKGISAGIYILVNEIEAQQNLLCAEEGNLFLFPEELQTTNLLQDIIALYSHYECAQGRKIEVTKESLKDILITDKSQLSQIIGNMLKNALEASLTDDIITIGCNRGKNNMIRFWVHNPQHMRQDICDQIFSRSFSTKGSGRGVGTYSIKLLGERYLKGRVSFSSTREEGTTFAIVLPQHPEA